MTASFGYLFNYLAHCQCGFSPREYGDRVWSYAGKQLRRLFPDATTADASIFIASSNIQVSKDGDVLLGGGTAKNYPTNVKLGGSFSVQYIDGGADMSRGERLEVLAGFQSGGGACFGLCVGRHYSPQPGGIPIGTWSLGIGAPGISFGTTGFSSQIFNLYDWNKE
jgi:hypothetical protein